ncbi:MAG: hypothetical protein SGARI_004348 [Bacillariaceae sp.]
MELKDLWDQMDPDQVAMHQNCAMAGYKALKNEFSGDSTYDECIMSLAVLSFSDIMLIATLPNIIECLHHKMLLYDCLRATNQDKHCHETLFHIREPADVGEFVFIRGYDDGVNVPRVLVAERFPSEKVPEDERRVQHLSLDYFVQLLDRAYFHTRQSFYQALLNGWVEDYYDDDGAKITDFSPEEKSMMREQLKALEKVKGKLEDICRMCQARWSRHMATRMFDDLVKDEDAQDEEIDREGAELVATLANDPTRIFHLLRSHDALAGKVAKKFCIHSYNERKKEKQVEKQRKLKRQKRRQAELASKLKLEREEEDREKERKRRDYVLYQQGKLDALEERERDEQRYREQRAQWLKTRDDHDSQYRPSKRRLLSQDDCRQDERIPKRQRRGNRRYVDGGFHF